MPITYRLSAAESILGILTDSIQPPKGPAVDPCSHILHARIEELIQRLTSSDSHTPSLPAFRHLSVGPVLDNQ